MRANARGVLIGGIIVLLLVCGWWGYREFAPLEAEKTVKRKSGSREKVEGLGIISFLDEQLSARFGLSDKNPFFTRALPKPPDMPPALPEVGVAVTPVPPALPTPGRPAHRPFVQRVRPVLAPKATPEPEGEVVTLEYKGIFKRADGRTLALLRDSKSESSRFYSVGSELHGMKVAQFSAERVNIVGPDGNMTGLKLGEPTDFELPENAEDGEKGKKD